ncbi:MAG: fibronectin type III domain-containing protein [Candidatus Wolfebacteria bacterium]|nr:fibronectin type III domain-containing protein [Candidatus Wolfebacteria bacterium]
MKKKLLASILAGLTILSLVAFAPFASADRGGREDKRGGRDRDDDNLNLNRGQMISSFVRGLNSGPGSINSGRDRDDDDDDDDEDLNDRDENRGRGNVGAGISDGRIQALERLIVLIQEQIQILLARLNELRGDVNTVLTISSVAATEIKITEAKVVWLTSRSADSKVYFSTASPVDLATARTKSKGGLEFSHRVSLDGLSPNTTYFFIVESKDTSNNVVRSAQFSFTTLSVGVDNAAPILSSLIVTNIASSSAEVKWVTNKSATSKAYFSTSSPVNLGTALTVVDASLVTSHSLRLTGLSASTTYFFVVESFDAASSVTRSAQLSFNTVSAAAPVISVISVSGLSSSTATISWTTDTLSTSKVYFSTSTPVNVLSAQTASSSALVTSHLIVLTGLSANTNYYFVIESVDVISNVSRSSQFSFLTTL